MRAKDPKAKKILGFRILDEQHAELEEEFRRFKARLVAGGNNIIDADGLKVVEKLSKVAPGSLDAFRVANTYSLVVPGGKMAKDAVRGAYLKSQIEPGMWLSLERELWPPEWEKLGYDEPVVPLEGALYGLSRSGYEWGWRCRKEMVKAGYEWVRDVGEDSLYVKYTDGGLPVFVVLCVGDLAIAGPPRE